MKPDKSFVQMAMDWVRTGDASDLKEKYPPNSGNELLAMCVITSAQKEVQHTTNYGVPSYWLR